MTNDPIWCRTDQFITRGGSVWNDSRHWITSSWVGCDVSVFTNIQTQSALHPSMNRLGPRVARWKTPHASHSKRDMRHDHGCVMSWDGVNEEHLPDQQSQYGMGRGRPVAYIGSKV